MELFRTAFNVYMREVSRAEVLQRLLGLTQTGNWGGGGEIALNVPESNINQKAWRKLKEAVFMRVEMGSARGLSQRSMLAYLFLASRIVAWNLVCVSAVMFIVRGRDGNPTANVTAMCSNASVICSSTLVQPCVVC